jgi:hypothetical protein
MGDADIRDLPRPRTACCRHPVRALKEGGIAEGSKVGNTCSSCAVRSRTWTQPARPAVRKFLGVIPFGDKVTDYFRRYESAQRPLETGSCTPCAMARTS